MLRSTQEPASLSQTTVTSGPGHYLNLSRPSQLPLASWIGDPSEAENHPLYKHWLDSGKPHNVICSECRGPNNLIFCQTCCRSYHGSCLPASDSAIETSQFRCPACLAGRWDHAAQMLNQLTSPATSRSATPFVRAPNSGIISPAAEMASSVHTTPTARSGIQTPFRIMDNAATPDAFDPSILSRARDFLRAHGGFPESQEFSMDLLLKLGAMMTELDFHRDQVQELASENAHLRQDNANIRAYLDSNLRTGRPFGPGGDFSDISRPSSDTTGKSWDRIVMDLI
ncbi:hypothetical protein BDV11DRAFT_192243 [Aspergillus similis]